MSAATDAACRSVLIVYENALDWQHLPHLHSSSFESVDCTSAGGWGWRATVSSGTGEAVIESELEHAWIVMPALDYCNLAGPNAGAEIWTHVFVVADRVLDIVVSFCSQCAYRGSRKSRARLRRAYEVLTTKMLT